MRKDEVLQVHTQYYKDSFYQNSIKSCSADSMYLSLEQQELFFKESLFDTSLDVWKIGGDNCKSDYGRFVKMKAVEGSDEKVKIYCSFDSPTGCKSLKNSQPGSPSSLMAQSLFYDCTPTRRLPFLSSQFYLKGV
jgi:hypothetical protein